MFFSKAGNFLAGLDRRAPPQHCATLQSAPDGVKMKTSSLAFLGAGLLLLVGCNAQQIGIGLSPDRPAQTSTSGSIEAGESVTGTFNGNPLIYTLTPTTSGRLTLRLAWDPDRDGAKLKLMIDDSAVMAAPPEWSPVVGVTMVSAGKTYRITIEEGAAPWDYGFNDQFTLMASLEPGSGPWDY